MKSSILCLLMVALTSEAMAACVCVIGPLHIYGNGAAICFAKRHETSDCAPGRCRNPINVWEYRLKGHWEHYPELCPGGCRLYGPRTALKAAEPERSSCTEVAPAEEPPETTLPLQPEGLPVSEDFSPVESRTVLEGSEAQQVGFFTLRTADKIATNVDSDSCVKVGQDIEVKVFRVRIPKLDEEQLIAYEVTPQNESAKTIESGSITNVRYEPHLGDRILSLQVSHPEHAQLNGKTIYLLRGPKTD